MIKRKDLWIRDPFILTDKKNKLYYVYGTTELRDGLRAGNSFSVYVSNNLKDFDGPYVVFDGEKYGFWADKDYWAAEVHKYKGKYYLIGSFKADNKCRATCILVSDSPKGPFIPVSDMARTPEEWECLDGTLYIENGEPYLVYSHEWLQCTIGEIWAQKMSDDLSEPIGERFLFFKACNIRTITRFK